LLLGYFDLGWLPNDDGTLAQSAERVQAGELPHVDFDEPYTGGLSFLNSLAFDVFEPSMAVLRYPLVGLAILWMFVLYGLARQWLTSIHAALLAVGLMSGSVFLYMTPMPSWYNLFLGTFAVAAMLRFDKTGKIFWVAASGFLVGLSVLVKVTGIYFALPVVFVLLQSDAVSDRPVRRELLRRILLVAALGTSTLLVLQQPTVSRLFGFVIPIAAVCAAGWKKTSSETLHSARMSAVL